MVIEVLRPRGADDQRVDRRVAELRKRVSLF
jgi:hypothetical protein